jgi:bifunctional non-homologous end joining protein LigD
MAQVGELALATTARSLEELGDARAYLFELKYDGYRVLAAKRGDEVRLDSRNRHDWTARMAPIADAVRALPARACLLDGEVCALDAQGLPSFERLQRWLSRDTRSPHGLVDAQAPLDAHGAVDARDARDARLSYVVFDLLHVDGRDLRGLPLERRRALLTSLLGGRAASTRGATAEPSMLVLSSALEAGPVERDGDRYASVRSMLRAVRAAGLEGLMAKRRDAPYREGRTRDWLKLKCARRQELAILGYVPEEGSRASPRIGALLLGVADGAGGFRYAGKVGTGFDARTARELAARLERARVAAPSPRVRGAPHDERARWSTPELVAEISFTEWTSAGRARHAVFLGLREDRRPDACVREIVLEGAATR